MPGFLPPPPPRQSIRGFPGYSEHPWIVHGCLASYPPHPSEYPWIWMPGFLPPPPPVRVSVDSLDTLNIPGSSMDAWLPTPPPPPRQSIRGFPGYSEHPWIIHGCLASYPPPVRVSVDSLDNLNIPDGCLASYTHARAHTGQSICRYSSLITQDILGSFMDD